MNTYNNDKMYESYSSEAERMQKCIDELQQENQQLKIQISAREEEYKKLEDKYINNVPCCNEDDCDLYRNYMKLEDNWNELKWYIMKKDCHNGTFTYLELIGKMKELERGSDRNE